MQSQTCAVPFPFLYATVYLLLSCTVCCLGMFLVYTLLAVGARLFESAYKPGGYLTNLGKNRIESNIISSPKASTGV